MDLPPDLANGMVLNILKNIPPNTKETKVSYVAATPRPRLVKLLIVPQGEDKFSVAGSPYNATLFVVKVELGGITGILASLVGKQPPDTKVWVVGGRAPVFVKAEQSLYPNGPVWRIETTAPGLGKRPECRPQWIIAGGFSHETTFKVKRTSGIQSAASSDSSMFRRQFLY